MSPTNQQEMGDGESSSPTSCIICYEALTPSTATLPDASTPCIYNCESGCNCRPQVCKTCAANYSETNKVVVVDGGSDDDNADVHNYLLYPDISRIDRRSSDLLCTFAAAIVVMIMVTYLKTQHDEGYN